jgi:HSP20 family protein
MNSLVPLATRLERFDDMFPEIVRRFMRPLQMDVDLPSEIRVDVTEDDKEYRVRAEVPGAKKEDIRVSVDGNYVSISAEVKQEKEEKAGNGSRTLIKELYYGSASRGFTLSHDVDDKAAVVKYEDGILKLTLPKRKEAATKVLRIQ